MDNETKERFESVDARFDALDARLDKMMAGIAQQFEAMQKYMDQRFNEVIEAIEFRTSPLERKVRDHERRLRQLEKM